jgi:hypothetical protein
MVEQVSELPRGYKAIGPVDQIGAGKAIALAESLRDEKNALALLTQHFKQHAEKFPKDFDAAGLVFRVVATVENTPQRGWGTLVVEFGYRPHHGAKKKAL